MRFTWKRISLIAAIALITASQANATIIPGLENATFDVADLLKAGVTFTATPSGFTENCSAAPCSLPTLFSALPALSSAMTDGLFSIDAMPKGVISGPAFLRGLNEGTSRYFKWQTRLDGAVTSVGRMVAPAGTPVDVLAPAGFNVLNWSQLYFTHAGPETATGTTTFTSVQTQFLTATPSDVPEPAGLAIFGAGLMALAVARKKNA